MKFGPVSLVDAEGGILAHSLHLGGLSLKKGRRLSDDDLASLREAGVETVTVAGPEAGDVDEDAAAARIAEALADENIRAERPFTGRVNLLAAARGLLKYDPAGLDGLNLVNEAITIAALPSLDPVEPGMMVATVKIIPFFVPGALLDQAVARARELQFQAVAYRPSAVGLVQSILPGTRKKVLEKTAKVLRTRVERLASRLAADHRCEHEAEAIADAIRRQIEKGFDLILVAGASAITDRRDVVPTAIERAGGKVLHFGMPVDPGNLILLGQVGAIPVVGIPGCARSPKLNGFDWVLGRLLSGIPVTSEDIMRMGSGGLLSRNGAEEALAGSEAKGRVA